MGRIAVIIAQYLAMEVIICYVNIDLLIYIKFWERANLIAREDEMLTEVSCVENSVDGLFS